MKVIPYELARLKIHLKQISESINHAKDFQEKYWDYTPSITMLKDLTEDKMFPLTLGGLEKGMALLSR